MREEKTIQGIIKKEIFENSESNFRVFLFEKTSNSDIITVSGIVPKLIVGVEYKLTGYYVENGRYAGSFKIEKYTQIKIEDKDSFIKYLSSDNFPGIGEKTAEKIYDIIGKDAINLIIDDYKILVRNNILNDIRALKLQKALLENYDVQQTLIELYNLGLSNNLALLLYEKYGKLSKEIVLNDPYKLAYEISGIGFLKADNIALKNGFSKNDNRRLKAAILYSMDDFSRNSGNTYMTIDQINENTSKILCQIFDLSLPIKELVEEDKIININNIFYLKDIYKAEETIKIYIEKILNYQNTKESHKFLNFDYEKALKNLEDSNHFKYTKSQKEAIISSLKNNITIITGGPGSGKTTIISGILKLYSMINDIYYDDLIYYTNLMAPTGRAAKRMNQILNLNATTIHRALKVDERMIFTKNKDNPLNSRLIIIDEASMIDTFLAANLFEAITPSTKVIIVGDVDQLPSVGPGQILYDLIKSNKIPVVYLKETHRQSSDSNIIYLANLINTSKISNKDLITNKDTYFYNFEAKTNYEQKMLDLIIDSCMKAYETNKYSMIDDIQILVPKYNGTLGIHNINKIIQNKYIKDKTIFVEHRDNIYYVGDKIIQQVNNPEKEIMNGDSGYIFDIYENTQKEKIIVCKYDDKEVLYSKNELDEIQLAYAISIHKSQGSEYKIVILPICSQYYFMLKKQLMYTAVTRAKEMLLVIGELKYVVSSANLNIESRQTGLFDLLNNSIESLYFNSYEKTNETQDEDDNLSPYDFMD